MRTAAKLSRWSAAALLVVGLGACGSAPPSAPTTRPGAPATDPVPSLPPPEGVLNDELRVGCPAALLGVTVEFRETADGIAYDFTANQSSLEDLRTELRELATWHNERAQGTPPLRVRAGQQLHRLPPSDAAVRDTPEGAELVLTPRNANDLTTLRQRGAGHLPAWQQGRCPLMD